MIMGKFKIVGQKFGVVCDLNVGVHLFFFFLVISMVDVFLKRNRVFVLI